jgi:hypothetical protein
MSRFITSFLVLVLSSTVFRSGHSAAADEAKHSGPKFKISKETTYVTGPIDKNGYIDYETALNKLLSKGVKPADNATVLLWKATGPHPEGATMPADFFRWLGVPAPPEKGEYFRDLHQYLKDLLQVYPDELIKDIGEQSERAAQRPWTEKQYPYIAGWLKANKKPLALVIEATRRPRYFSPLVSRRKKDDPSCLIAALLPGVQKCRELANALATRAMLRVGQGRYDEAWQDLLALHRLGRLVAQGGTLIEGLVGIAIDSSVARDADVGYLHGAKLSAKQAKACLRDLQKLPPMPSFADKLHLSERLIALDSFIMVSRGGLRQLQGLAGRQAGNGANVLDKVMQKPIDWDPALRSANARYDRVAVAMRLNDRRAREKQLDQVEKEMQDLKEQLQDPQALAKALLAEKAQAKALGKLMGDALMCLLFPAVRKVQGASDRAQQVQANLQVAFALAAYQRDHGRYPKKLEALAPAYLAQVPHDLFSGKDLIYRPTDGGYLLYSVGVNGRDEQGRSWEDTPPGDDLPVRMPLPKLPRN